MDTLPEEIARECLISSAYLDFPAIQSVCKGWKAQIECPEFIRDRKAAGKSQNVVVMAQVRAGSAAAMSHQLTVFEPATGNWRELPPFPEFSGRLPMFCGVVSIGSDLVVMGGWHPDTWEALSGVFVYSFLSGTWRHGANMPGGPRSFFGVASDLDRTVYVAGGHDGEKKALKTALAYDVAKNVWAPLPDMACERDECKGVFCNGKLHVIGGYGSELQGKFRRSAEAFDAPTWQWGPVDDDFLNANECPRNCVSITNGSLYTCHKGDVVTLKGDTWEVAAKLPADVCKTIFVMMWQDNLLVMGSTGNGEPHITYVLNLKSYTWAKVETPEKFSKNVVSSCCLEI